MPLRDEAGEPRQPAEAHDPGRRLGPGRGRRGRHARRAGLPRALLFVSRQPAARPLDRRPGRDQRRQELPQRRRQHLTASFTTRSKAATSAPARPTLTGWRRSASTSSTSASPRACRSPGNMAGCSRPGRSAASRSSERFTPAARPASSCCSAPTRRSSGRSPPDA